MSFRDIIEGSLSDWIRGDGPFSDVVLSSRIRLARNLEDMPFPHVASEGDLKKVLEQVEGALRGMRGLGNLRMVRLAEMAPLDRQILVEKHLISPQHAENVKYKAVILRQDETISIMVNEEDHIRIQTIFPGLQLENGWQLASQVDDAFEAKLGYAFDEKIGYIAACPTNAGTGLRASVMVHLPALAMTNQVGKVLSAVSHVGMAVRGLYGEGTEARGNIYQISNQVTLGRSEEDIMENLKGVTKQVIDQERSARSYLLRETKEKLEDTVYRAYGILSNARLLTSEEALRLLSDVRLGIDAGLITEVDGKVLGELMVLTRPAYLQKLVGRELSPFERDFHRAAHVRERMRKR